MLHYNLKSNEIELWIQINFTQFTVPSSDKYVHYENVCHEIKLGLWCTYVFKIKNVASYIVFIINCQLTSYDENNFGWMTLKSLNFIS